MPLGWLQLKHKPLRLLVALSGIAFAVLLIMMQLGFRSALFESAVRFHERFDYDIALFSPDSVFIVRPQSFSIRRLYQTLGFDAVDSVTPVYISTSVWKNPWDNNRRRINTIGFQPDHPLLRLDGFDQASELLRRQDVVLFDSGSRPEFGAVEDALLAGQPVVTEINDRNTEVVGLFEMGTSFGIDGTIITSEDNWLRLFPSLPRSEIHLGLIRLQPGRDAQEVRDALAEYLPEDVLVLTKQQFVQREKDYWNSATPIGYIFAFGAIMGFVVGAIIVYQILFADVSDHLPEYATLKAMGYTHGYLRNVVLQEAVILAVLGYLPGLGVAYLVFNRGADATRLPLEMSLQSALGVFALTVAMCAGSGLLALRKLRAVDPAEVF